VRAIEGGHGTHLALKPLAETGITGDVREQDLYSDEAVETSVASFVDSPIPPAPMAARTSYAPSRVLGAKVITWSARILRLSKGEGADAGPRPAVPLTANGR
jgi:hypothetical protein